MPEHPAATLVGITVFPIKSLDGVPRSSARITERGALEHDRHWVLMDDAGKPYTAKRDARFHLLRTTFDEDITALTLAPPDGQSVTFDLHRQGEAVGDWFSGYFSRRLRLRSRPGGFPDDAVAHGPTVVTTQSLAAVASWFPTLDTEQVRRRMRANLELDAPAPFWEDYLVSDLDKTVPFRIGDVELRGVSACGRCVVPTRDPTTGEPLQDFQPTFTRQRETTLPADVNRARFNHYFRLTVRTSVPEDQWGRRLSLGDTARKLSDPC